MLRCINCRTTRSTAQLMFEHQRKHPECAPCTCGGYHFPHRRGSTYCDGNVYGSANRAGREGASDEEVATIRYMIDKSRECPF